MAELIIADLEDDVREKLQDLARGHGRSVEEEAHDILRGAVLGAGGVKSTLGTRLANRFSKCGLDEEIAELRGHPVTPPSFEP